MTQADFLAALSGTSEMTITVTGRSSGRSFSYPIWFALEGTKLFLLPVRGGETDWYKNVRMHPSIHLSAHGKTIDARANLIVEDAQVDEVVQKFRDKYGTGTVQRLYSRLDVAVEVSLE